MHHLPFVRYMRMSTVQLPMTRPMMMLSRRRLLLIIVITPLIPGKDCAVCVILLDIEPIRSRCDERSARVA